MYPYLETKENKEYIDNESLLPEDYDIKIYHKDNKILSHDNNLKNFDSVKNNPEKLDMIKK